MSGAQVTYTPYPHSTVEDERDPLISIYRRSMKRYEEAKEGGPPQTAPDDRKGPKHDPARTIIPPDTS